MAAGRGRHWDWLASAAGLVFVIGLCLHWYRSNDDNWTGISNLGMEGKLMFIGGLFAIAVPFVTRMRQSAGRIQQYRWTVLVIGLLLVAWTIFRMADPPEFDSFSDLPVTLEAGAWITLVAAVLIVVFNAIAMRATLAKRPARSATA
jgi:uncharacterized membrane protein YjfL (UPF0719 family)